jgi:hypothetical protein
MVERAERGHATYAADRFFPEIGYDRHVFFFVASGAGDSYPAVSDITDL